MKKVILLCSLTVLSGCALTDDTVATIKEVNDVSFGMAITKACSITAVPAAERSLNEDQLAALQLFCSELRRFR